ncbi:heterokaryon incompatibility protein-domain-containing protein [Sordaria brevicollis]|uniref:Heterokaryon incompatibility protein-domain-containing protein n=1 Tax=Sordaria brevicollis TaxID=83679 RepID=A0AAE0U9M3_SORBR|nr:heterokaryon incompatibility protein-domain-containing protein [Sordaria brevicollis]
MESDSDDLNPLANWRQFTSTTTLAEDDYVATSEYCPARAFTSLTLPFPSSSDPSGTLYVVRRIVFTVTSHDQGFCGEELTKGTYADSQTFFDCYIVQPNGQERVRRRIIQYNVTAESDYTTHRRVWDYRNNLSWEDWLGAIRSGDEIRLVPRANFISWTNFVQGASIEVWVEAVTPDSPAGSAVLSIDFSRWNDYLMYRPLDTLNREIRLVELEPSDDDDEVISFVLRYTPLADTKGRLKYSALSYCWGSADEAQPVMIRDENQRKNLLASVTMSVNRNLHSALRKLRRRHEPQILWIDLLCIKQSDLKERAQQVELMGEIYSTAHTVYVWLGEGDEWSHEDCEMIQSVEESYKRLLPKRCQYNLPLSVANGEQKPVEGSTDQEQDGSNAEHAEDDPLHPHNTHRKFWIRGEVGMCFDQIFELPWFRRVWVLQEVWNRMVSTTSLGDAAPDEVTCGAGGVSVLCGSYELTWSSIIHANLCLESHRQYLQNKIMPRIWSSLFHIERRHLSCDEIQYLEPEDIDKDITPQLCIKTADRLPILEALLGGLDMEATDSRDKIFAILSFGEETHDISELPPLARPNYEKTTVEVFADFTRWWISHYGTLNILSAVHAQPWRTWMDLSPLNSTALREFDHSQRPSWSLWYEGRSEWSLGTLGLFNNGRLDLCASEQTSVDQDLLLSGSDTGTLVLKGFCVDVIKGKEMYPYSTWEPYANSTRMLAAYEVLFDPTSVLDMWDMTKLNWQQSLAAKLNEGQSDGDEMLARGASWEEEAEKLGAHLGSHGSTSLFSLPRQMFKTEGDRAGLCPAGTREGDMIVILYGGNVPYLLRPAEDKRFHLVGECYLDGFMHGEAMELLHDDGSGVKEEVFVLV